MMTCVARVAMKGCMSYLATKNPFSAPKAMQASTARRMGSQTLT